MTTNPYFNFLGHDRTQRLIEDLIIESIKTYGYDIKYIPRVVIAEDNLFGEDALSRFNVAADIEVYIKNVDGFEGQGRFLSKFGIEIRDTITFTMARRRYDEIRTEKLLVEDSYNLLLESSNTNYAGQHSSIILEEGTGNNYSLTSAKPLEGDLVWMPMTNKLFEIKYVNYEIFFYQFGSLQVYDIECEAFEYSSERFDTGYSDIDTIEDLFKNDLLEYQMQLEDGGIMRTEANGSFILESVTPEDTDAMANNSLYKGLADNVVDWSERSPLVDTGGKW